LPREIDALLGELATNGLDDSEIEQQMRDLGQTLARLADGPLPAIDLELTAAAKSLPTADQHLAEIADSLGRAAASQDEVIGTLEGLLDELAEWAGYQRFAREVAQIRKEQLALRETTGQEIGLAATTGRAAREQQANLERAAEAQQVLSRRFDKLGQDIRWAADELAVGDPSAAATLADALDLARDLGTSAKFHEATRNLQENRVGRAMAGQQQVADDLEQLLGTLRNRREHDLARLIEQLKQAESDLAQLRDELAELREDIEAAEQAPESLDKKRELERLRREADQVQEATERMARRLER
jgi:uncharacterized protein YdcH (DUF465 family)